MRSGTAAEIQTPVKAKDPEGSETIRDDGDVVFDFIHSVLYKNSASGRQEAGDAQNIPPGDEIDKAGS